jgi:antitoxin FitA
MATLTVRNIDESLRSRLHQQATIHGRSMEEEARAILSAALAPEAPQAKGLGSALNALFQPLGGIDLKTPQREPMREPPSFD